MTVLLEARGLVKQFDKLRAVDGVSLNLDRVRCLGLLGPNGAGKTTTVEMLEGLILPTAGSIRYRGESLGQGFRNEAGIMFQSTALQDYMTTREALAMFRKFYPHGLSLDELVERCALAEFLDRDTRKLSGGQRQRVLLAIALVNDPQIIFLDEPTTGLDPQARRNFWDLVLTIKAQGKTVLLTTHYMDEAYYLSDEIAIMDRGRIIAEGTPGDLLAEHFSDVVLELPKADLNGAAAGLPFKLLERGDSVEILTADVNDALRRLIENGASLAKLRVRAPDLEDLFLELTGRELRS